MKIDTDVKHAGERSLRITNYSPTAPHVFTTLSQRISQLVPNTTYTVTCWVKAQDLKPGAVSFALDAAWTKRFKAIYGGPYEWRLYSNTMNVGHNNYIDFRILHLNPVTVWLDDIMIREVVPTDETESFEQAEKRFHESDYGKALEILKKLKDRIPEKSGRRSRSSLLTDPIYLILGQYSQPLERFNQVIQAGYSRAVIDLAVAKILGVNSSKDIFFQTRATEYNLKRLLLNRYRHLLFATHGLMAGEFGPGTQPALALSFINDPENDGLLEMGEILGPYVLVGEGQPCF
jgi:hypothetical protein